MSRAGRVGDFDKAPAVEHKARPPAVGDESPRPVELGIRNFASVLRSNQVKAFFSTDLFERSVADEDDGLLSLRWKVLD